MIIACPECTSPFQVLDDQIAALVQVECPTCRFRMILDFEAANDASLQEAGMRMAQGFRDEAAYRQAVGDGSVTYEATRPAPTRVAPEPARPVQPAARPAPEPARLAPEPARPVVRQPTPTPAPTPAVVQPDVAPTLEPVHAPEARPAKPPVRARPTLIAPGAPPPVRQPPTPQPSPHELGVEARVDTHVGRGPEHEYELEPEPAAPIEVPRPADRTQLEVPADEFAVDFDEPELEPEVPVARRKPAAEPVDVDEPSTRTPSHSPSIEPGKSKPARDDVPEVDDKRKTKPDGKKKGSFLRTFFVSLFLLIVVAATGLIVWSVIETNDPNPLPMLRDKFGLDLSQYGIPVGGSSEAPADTQ